MYGADDPLSAIPFAEKVALCQRSMRPPAPAIRGVAQVSVSLAASWSVIDIVRADGFVAHDVRPLVRLERPDRRAGRKIGARRAITASAGAISTTICSKAETWNRRSTSRLPRR
jgi:hypothetical protein